MSAGRHFMPVFGHKQSLMCNWEATVSSYENMADFHVESGKLFDAHSAILVPTQVNFLLG